MERAARAFTALAGLALALLALLVVADVALRYGRGQPIFFAHDVVVLYLTPALFFLGFGPTYWRGEHLSVDILTTKMPLRGRAASRALSDVIGLGLFALLTWVAFERAATSFLQGEVIASIVPWPAWASYALVPLGSAFMTIVCAVRLTTSLREVATGDVRADGAPASDDTGGASFKRAGGDP